MKFRSLNIQTQRLAPSNSRTEGFSLLVRANYLTRENEPTHLGQFFLDHLRTMSQVEPPLFFEKLKLPILQVDEEVFFPINSGHISLLECEACHYIARSERAKFQKNPSDSGSELPLEKVATPDCKTIDSLAKFLGIPKAQTGKALMFTRVSDGRFIFASVRGDMQLGEVKLREQVGDFRIASAEEVVRSGAVAGYASSIGLKLALVVVDDLIPRSTNLVIGANESGYHWKNSNYGRDYSAEIIADIVQANAGDPCPRCGKALSARSVELLSAVNGCHFETILSAIAEVHHDGKGLTLPIGVSAFDVYLMQLSSKEMDTAAKAEEIYNDLQNAGIKVLFDDRDERAGVKFNDADLVGCPLRITVGERNLKEGMVELKPRSASQNQIVRISDLSKTIQSLIKTLP